MGELKERRLVVCLNPRHTTGKLYALTDRGREAALCAFGLKFPAIPKGLNWRKYAQVVRARGAQTGTSGTGMLSSQLDGHGDIHSQTAL